ncbi:hypothetical protein CD006_11980 [Enterobacter sp. 10-1]|nr:hypothetical protein CD006_11980 [Enterobacter sp. 10-1]
MMSRELIQKASSGFPTYRESTLTSNGNLIYTKMCYEVFNDMIIKDINGFLTLLKRTGKRNLV